jgi:5-methylthioadenosine/S-adenosylhomocysteine deaminase
MSKDNTTDPCGDSVTAGAPPIEAIGSRRRFLIGAGLLAGATTGQFLPGSAAAEQASGETEFLRELSNPNGRHVRVRNAIVLSMDPQVGDFERGDILIQGKKIVSVGPNLQVPETALTIDAAGMIVMPGLVDTHHHQYEGILRSTLADGIIPANAPKTAPDINYVSLIQRTFTPLYSPEDARIAELLSSLSQINAGVTTTVDTSQVQLTPEHTEACIAGLKESGRRAVFAYWPPGKDDAAALAETLTGLRKKHFSSDDQLLTLATQLRLNPAQWRVAKGMAIPIVTHIVGTAFGDLEVMVSENLMGPDNEYIHCTLLSSSMWKRIADTGGKVSVSPAIEMQMQHGIPPIQEAIDHGIRPSLSVDVECSMTADLFTVMRAAFTLQRAMANERIIKGESDAPDLLNCRDVLELATINGARVAHLDSKIGSITPGKEADLIFLATDRINTFPLNNVPGAIVTLMDTGNVEHVVIAGKVVKWRGQLVNIGVQRLRQQAQTACDGLFARANYKRELFGSCCAMAKG